MPDLYALPKSRAAPRGRRVSVLAIVAVLFLGFIIYQVAATIQESHTELEQRGLETGDRIEYDFTTRLSDGTLRETTIYQVALRANRTHDHPLFAPPEYVPQRAVLDPDRPGLGWGPEVERAVLAAHVGQNVRVTVEPQYSFGDWGPFLPDEPGVPRSFRPQPFFRSVFLQEAGAAQEEGNPGTPNFDLDQLDQAIGPVHTGFVFNAEQEFPPSWDIVFEDVNRDNRSVLLRHTVADGQFFDVPDLPGGITVLIDEERDELTYRLDLETGSIFVVRDGSALIPAGFTPGSYHVVDQDDETIQLNYHRSQDPELIGQPMHVEIRILRKL